jgi:hypothetical protein
MFGLPFDTHTVAVLGGIYAAIQAIANVLTMVLPANTIAFKVAKQVIAGSARNPTAGGNTEGRG